MGLRKATAAAFDRRAAEYVASLGATQDPPQPRHSPGEHYYTLETRAGAMTVHPSTSPHRGKRTGLFTVFCKFEDVARMREVFNVQHLDDLWHMNQFTGKYNFHDAGHDDALEAALRGFEQHIARVLK